MGPIQALLWEQWRQTRGAILFSVTMLAAYVLSEMYNEWFTKDLLLRTGGSISADWHIIADLIIAPALFFLFTNQDVRGISLDFSRRRFVLPVSTGKMMAALVGYNCLAAVFFGVLLSLYGKFVAGLDVMPIWPPIVLVVFVLMGHAFILLYGLYGGWRTFAVLAVLFMPLVLMWGLVAGEASLPVELGFWKNQHAAKTALQETVPVTQPGGLVKNTGFKHDHAPSMIQLLKESRDILGRSNMIPLLTYGAAVIFLVFGAIWMLWLYQQLGMTAWNRTGVLAMVFGNGGFAMAYICRWLPWNADTPLRILSVNVVAMILLVVMLAPALLRWGTKLDVLPMSLGKFRKERTVDNHDSALIGYFSRCQHYQKTTFDAPFRMQCMLEWHRFFKPFVISTLFLMASLFVAVSLFEYRLGALCMIYITPVTALMGAYFLLRCPTNYLSMVATKPVRTATIVKAKLIMAALTLLFLGVLSGVIFMLSMAMFPGFQPPREFLMFPVFLLLVSWVALCIGPIGCMVFFIGMVFILTLDGLDLLFQCHGGMETVFGVLTIIILAMSMEWYGWQEIRKGSKIVGMVLICLGAFAACVILAILEILILPGNGDVFFVFLSVMVLFLLGFVAYKCGAISVNSCLKLPVVAGLFISAIVVLVPCLGSYWYNNLRDSAVLLPLIFVPLIWFPLAVHWQRHR